MAIQYRNLQDVDGNIEKAHASYQSMRKSVQIAAVSVLFHAEKHGDYSKAATLIDGLEGLNQTALVEFFVKFGGFIVDEENGGFSGWSGKDYIRENFGTAKATMWWELKKQSPYKGFDLNDQLWGLIEKAKKAQELAAKDPEKAEKIDVNEEELAKLRVIAQDFQAAA